MGHAGEKETLREETAIALTSFMLHKHYCENDVEALIRQMDEEIHWLGAAEGEYAVGRETVAGIFRQFAGKVPKCNITDEEYHALQLAPDVYLCTGQLWIETDSSTQISLRVHQRITTIFRWRGDCPRCCHIHISNPYDDMVEEDVGFPTKIARQSYQYLQEQVRVQKERIADQTAILRRMSYEDGLTGVFNRNKFNSIFEMLDKEYEGCLGVACFDLNGLKAVNDQMGHSAGDDLIRRAADQIRRVFGEKVYRTGGDEFVVVDETLEKEEFCSAVGKVQRGMEENGISYAVGLSWRSACCSIKEQLEEADQRMYQEKRRFYSIQGVDRSGR